MNRFGTFGVIAVLGIVLVGAGAYAMRPAHNAVPGPIVVATSTEEFACNADGKVCPDGSVVGRSGPLCEFTACPSPTATSSTVTTYVGGTVTGLNISVTPKQVVSDSRCPRNVQCIWAGTVEVRAVLASQTGHGEHVLTLGKPQTFGDYSVTLVAVTPAVKTAGVEIPVSSYRLTFEIKKL